MAQIEMSTEPRSQAKVLNTLALAVPKTNGFEQAEEWAEEALVIREKRGDQLGIADSLKLLATFYREQGQIEKSESLNERSLDIFQSLGNQPFIVYCLQNLAVIKGNRGQFIEGQSLVKESLKIVNELGMRSDAAFSYEIWGWTTIHLGDYVGAREYLEKARSFYLEFSYKFGQGLILADLSMIELAERNYIEAKNLSQKGLIIFQELEYTYLIGFLLAYLAYAERGLNNPDVSRQYVIKALSLTIQAGTLEALLDVLLPAALLLADQGKTERAMEIYSLAAQRPYVANSQWVEDVAGQHIKAAATSLPPERIQAAEERGRERDFWQTAKELLETDFADAGIMEISDKQRPLESDIASQPVVEPVTSESRFAQKSLVTTGGHGELYLGEDTATGQQVIIKRLKPELVAQHPEIVARFIREGEALRQLNHPNIVKMLAAEERDGAHLIVMEYVPGGSMRELLDAEGQLPVRRVLDIGLELADALTRAHHLGIIHRDIKPANVLLAADGTPRLTDFGIAHLSQRETRLTQAGSFMGSPVYMSPEACRGETLDFGSDIWSFGALLYEMLAGRPPFAAEQIAATLVAILNDPVPDLNQFRSDVPVKLTALIHSMLIKERKERMNSARQVAAELEAIRNNLSMN
jgi:tetratricopeptide (TPR) repeat protein